MASKKKGFNQKLDAGKGIGGIKSKGAKAAGLPYKGYSLGDGVEHGAHGLLSSSGKGKKRK